MPQAPFDPVAARMSALAAMTQATAPPELTHMAHATPQTTTAAAFVAGSSSSTAGLVHRDTLEYQMAWDLEMWKRNEQARFEQQLQEVERLRLSELEREFSVADTKRQEQHVRKQAELALLEQKNKTFYQDLEAQEKKLHKAAAELELTRQQQTREDEQRRVDTALQLKRVKEEHAHQAKQWTLRETDWKHQVDVLKDKVTALESRNKDLEKQYSDYRDKMSKSVVDNLYHQVAELEVELRTSQTALTQSRSAESELQHLLQRLWKKHTELKQAHQQTERMRAQAATAELQQVKLSMMAQDAAHGLSREAGDLAGIKADLHRIMAHSLHVPLSHGMPVAMDPSPPSSTSTAASIPAAVPVDHTVSPSRGHAAVTGLITTTTSTSPPPPPPTTMASPSHSHAIGGLFAHPPPPLGPATHTVAHGYPLALSTATAGAPPSSTQVRHGLDVECWSERGVGQGILEDVAGVVWFIISVLCMCVIVCDCVCVCVCVCLCVYVSVCATLQHSALWSRQMSCPSERC
jgi:hypothetical protein